MTKIEYTLEEQHELGNILDNLIPYCEDQILLLGEEMKYDLFQEDITGGSVKRAVQYANAKKRRVDRKVSNAIDNTYDAATKGDKRDEIKSIRQDIMRGEGKPSTVLKRAIKIALGSAAVTTAAGSAALAPAVALIGFIISTCRREHISHRERDKIIFEMEQELKIVEEKIKDAESDGDKKKKYQYMRIQMELEKNIKQLKYSGKLHAGDNNREHYAIK